MANMAKGIAGLVAATIGVMMLVMTFIIVPMVGYQMDQSIEIANTSNWHSDTNADIPQGYDLWTDLSGIISVAALVMIVAGIFTSFKALKETD